MIAAGRARRPGAARGQIPPATEEELDTCPFCEGREERTPPEAFAIASVRRDPDTPGWQVRVVPNLYPALEHQEVVVHTPRHARSLAELFDEEVALVAESWQARAGAVPGYLHALVNEGADAGSSLPHTHSQLVWLRGPPPAVTPELDHRSCPLCPPPGGEELVVAERGGSVARAAWAGRLPYELLIAPREHETDPWRSAALVPALQLAAEALRRLTAIEGPRPANLWLHHGGGHWHLELLPRLSVLAGLELGAGIYVNTLAPEDAAAALRDAL